jgi:hypothetical protein
MDSTDTPIPPANSSARQSGPLDRMSWVLLALSVVVLFFHSGGGRVSSMAWSFGVLLAAGAIAGGLLRRSARLVLYGVLATVAHFACLQL